MYRTAKTLVRVSYFSLVLALGLASAAKAADTVEDYIAQYPNQQQTKMMNAWLETHQPGTFSFSGLVDPTDTTVVTPQATVDYGYNWFSLSNGPAIISTPQYDRFFSVSVFDMKHNVPAVITNPQRPIVIVRPGQAVPEGDYTVVNLETDQGLVFTRMVVVDNMQAVRKLSEEITMRGGDGDMQRAVETFSPDVEKQGLAAIQAALPQLNPDKAFGKKSGDVPPLVLAGAVMMGQLGTPSDTVRYAVLMGDDSGVPFNGKDSYVLTVPADIVQDSGYYSITVYGTDDKALIPNAQGRYDRTTYSSTPNADGTYTVSLNPAGDGINGIPTGKDFYVVLRAYVPVRGADLTVQVRKRPAENPYTVERSWPDYFLKHQKLFTEQAGTYKAGKYPVWTVHVPGGWIGNSTIIEGKDGLIVYDTSVNLAAGAFIAAEIRKISDKPIKAIFYSHHHTDHYNGTSALVTPEQVASGEVKIYAWDNFEEEIANEFGAILPRQLMGVFYYGPDMLGPEEKHYHGCCSPKLLGGKSGYIPPTDTFSEDTQLEIAGVKIDVFYTGGEAISEFGLHLPEMDMVIIGDEFFYALANVHSIRGSKPRLPENYMKALDKVRVIQPEWLLGSHIMPMQGKDDIQQAVTASRDAIQYLWDQTIRYINKGYTPVELQHKFKELPEYLDMPPYTRPMYGTPWIIVPELYTGWVSWFNGDATNLLPTEPVEKSRRFVELMGGRDKVLAEAEKAFNAGDGQFAAELTQMLVSIDHNDWDARYLKAASLRQRGYEEMNTIARAWYLNGANELEGKVNPDTLMRIGMTVATQQMTAEAILASWRYQVDAEKAGAKHLVLGMTFTDSGATYVIALRNSILEIEQKPIPAGIPAVTLSTQQLRAVLAGEDVPLTGERKQLNELLSYLDRTQQGFQMHVR